MNNQRVRVKPRLFVTRFMANLVKKIFVSSSLDAINYFVRKLTVQIK